MFPNLVILGCNNESDVLNNRIQKTQVEDFSALDENDPRKISVLRRFAYVKKAIIYLTHLLINV